MHEITEIPNLIFIEQSNDMSRTINEKGCVQAGDEWIERNLIIISSTAIFLAFMQVSSAQLCLQVHKPKNRAEKMTQIFWISDFGNMFCTKFARWYLRPEVKMEMNYRIASHRLP